MLPSVMRSFVRWLNKRFSTFDLLPEYFTSAANQMQNILWGALLPFLAWGIWFIVSTPPTWINVCAIGLALFMAGYYVWRAHHLRLIPQLTIDQLVRDTWDVPGLVPEAQREATLWYFHVQNTSEGITVTGVNVELNEIIPALDNLDWLPVHLHIKHDNPIRPQDAILRFYLNPVGMKNVDFVSAITGDDHFYINHVLPEPINHNVPNGEYRIQVKVTANNLAPVFKWFKVWSDNGGLQCKME
jgi:hypothetical protein